MARAPNRPEPTAAREADHEGSLAEQKQRHLLELYNNRFETALKRHGASKPTTLRLKKEDVEHFAKEVQNDKLDNNFITVTFRDSISIIDTACLRLIPLQERAAALDKELRKGNRLDDQGVAGVFPEFFEHLVPSVQSHVSGAAPAPIPDKPFAIWKTNKLPRENPPAFIKRVYGEWLGKGLDRAHIRNLDPTLAQALDNWLRANALPKDVDLPTRNEQNLRWVERIEREGVGAIADGRDTDAVLRDAQRLLSVKRRRDRE